MKENTPAPVCTRKLSSAKGILQRPKKNKLWTHYIS